jgi:hypothetical protein
MEMGITPEILKMLADYLVDEIVKIELHLQKSGRMLAVVRVFDAEARELNGLAGVEGSGVELGEYYDEFYDCSYELSADGSRVVAVYDQTGTLVEQDPLPWSLRTLPESRRPERSGPRSRPSVLAERTLPA